MKRGLERKLVMMGATWNLFTALVTLFGYYGWFHDEGIKALQGANQELLVTGTSMMENISSVILTFGLFMFVMAIMNFLVGVHLKDNQIQKKITVWLCIWMVIQLLSMDIIGFLLYMLAFVFYLSKNKAIRLSEKQVKAV
ncbi:uncharacterized protein YneF (UPF0154 family) [Natronobacillus azotifigens]|uniref:DUF4064 domain-containing protein n=1 Tax=Natronobacillus azotifigens TaxID=472978 RepID=A0A9J6RA99_9BACI|nr:hypothetical protein [Natronobacillus azotifigens]MCZ0702463.1 hypothetical protein [Natronobacillus azotifigens]